MKFKMRITNAKIRTSKTQRYNYISLVLTDCWIGTVNIYYNLYGVLECDKSMRDFLPYKEISFMKTLGIDPDKSYEEYELQDLVLDKQFLIKAKLRTIPWQKQRERYWDVENILPVSKGR
jgi:hypothetical protein